MLWPLASISGTPSTPWKVIHEALKRMSFPLYIWRILRSYLGGRVLHLCDNDQGIPVTMEVTWGDPQDSVLGPFLWNIAFDVVLQLPMPRGTTAIGYADNTLVVTGGDTVDTVQECANVALETISDHIRGLDLRLSAEKT